MSQVRTFNTPLEAGLRALFVLAAAGRKSFDSQRLVYLDYLLVHSGDIDGPESLHPASPARKGELLVRRQLLQAGLALMRSRELVERKFQTSGIVYSASRAGRHVVDQFDSSYAQVLRSRAEWVVTSFGEASDKDLARLLDGLSGVLQDELIEEPHLPTGFDPDV